MRNKIGLTLFGVGFMGVLVFGSALDSPGNGLKVALTGICVSVLVATVGYL